MDDFEKRIGTLEARLAQKTKELETTDKERKRLLSVMRSFTEKEMDLREDLAEAVRSVSNLEKEMIYFLRMIRYGEPNALKMIEIRLADRFKNEVQD